MPASASFPVPQLMSASMIEELTANNGRFRLLVRKYARELEAADVGQCLSLEPKMCLWKHGSSMSLEDPDTDCLKCRDWRVGWATIIQFLVKPILTLTDLDVPEAVWRANVILKCTDRVEGYNLAASDTTRLFAKNAKSLDTWPEWIQEIEPAIWAFLGIDLGNGIEKDHAPYKWLCEATKCQRKAALPVFQADMARIAAYQKWLDIRKKARPATGPPFSLGLSALAKAVSTLEDDIEKEMQSIEQAAVASSSRKK